MIKLYFGNIPSILSTILFLIFVVFFIRTMKKNDGDRKWKKAAIITVLMGTAMSALSGIKDSVADTKFYYHCEDDCSRSTSYYRFSRKIKGYG